MPKLKYTKELLQEAVIRSRSYRGLTINLGVAPHGGSISAIKKRVIEYKIDISHFTGRQWSRGFISNKRKRVSDILSLNSNPKSNQIKRCLIEIGREYKCEVCGIFKWNDKNLALEIDHKNGIRTDNTSENLRFICPNCHSQTNNFKFNNKKHK
jgi:predicted RNA-binding Zn-ribbon protein involved in translation (DUF1610 family)